MGSDWQVIGNDRDASGVIKYGILRRAAWRKKECHDAVCVLSTSLPKVPPAASLCVLVESLCTPDHHVIIIPSR